MITLVLLVNKVSYCNLFFYFHSNLRLSIGAILISVTSVFLIKTKFLGSVFVAFKVYFVRDPVSDNSTSLHNQPFSNPALYIAITSEQVIKLLNQFGKRIVSVRVTFC